jgi:hypothetical protein
MHPIINVAQQGKNHWRSYVVEMSKSVAVKVFVREEDADIKDPSYRWKSS